MADRGHQPTSPSTNAANPPRGGSGVPSKSRRKSRPPADRTPKHGHGKLVTGGVDGGRPPDEFKRKMREMASSDEVLTYLQACLKGKHGPKIAVAAHRHITERGYGKVAQPVELTGEEGGAIEIEITRRIVRAEDQPGD